MILSNKRITKAQIRSGPRLGCSQTTEDRFSRVEAQLWKCSPFSRICVDGSKQYSQGSFNFLPGMAVLNRVVFQTSPSYYPHKSWWCVEGLLSYSTSTKVKNRRICLQVGASFVDFCCCLCYMFVIVVPPCLFHAPFGHLIGMGWPLGFLVFTPLSHMCLEWFCYLSFLILCFVSVMLSCLFSEALWSPVGKGLASWLSC